MAIYIDKNTVPDVENISSQVFQYLIRKHKKRLRKLSKNYDYYIGKHDILKSDLEDEEKVRIFSNYAKYIVDISMGYYLGEPVKYNTIEDKNKQSKTMLNSGVQASIKNGATQLYDWKQEQTVDISRAIEVYDNQTISETDAKIGKNMGIYGDAYELLYSNSDDIPEPRSTVIDSRNAIMVRDNTVEHNKLFFISYSIEEDLSDNKYYLVNVYTDRTSKQYKSSDLDNFEFHLLKDSIQEHYFGEVPVIEYQNNDERQGDFEQIIPLIDGLNELLSDRITDKKKFVNSLLAMFGVTLDEDDIKTLNKERFLDGIPTDSRIEYIQKVFDEGSMSVLCNDIIREIHKQTLTVDMTDENFAGNSSGQALMLKLMTMNMLVKNKMRSFEKGLKKRFEMYNYWLSFKNEMQLIDKKELDVIFTVSLPIDKQEILATVTALQGIVDNKTLISQLWFVKDADSVLEALKKQKLEEQQEYLDSIGMQKALEQSFDGSIPDTENQEEGGEEYGLQDKDNGEEINGEEIDTKKDSKKDN